MTRTTLVGAETDIVTADDEGSGGSLKIFFGYAPCSGTTAAMLDETQGLVASGRDVFVAEPERPDAPACQQFDLDQVLKRRPDVVVLEDLARPNPAGSRNRTRFQDAEELMRAGIDVYATLRVSDLQSEREHVEALGAPVPPESVPDYLFYGARQLEFVDIDPSELVRRARASGRQIAEDLLIALRVLALRCVGEYAATAGLSRGPRKVEETRAFRSRIVAVVQANAAPARILLEASRLAAVSQADLEVVCVRGEGRPGGAGRAQDDAYEALRDQVEAMGHELVTFYADDAADVVADYLRTQGATDVVVGRRPSRGRRWLAPFAPSLGERLAEGLPGVSVHLVALDDGMPLRPSFRGFSPGGHGLRDTVVALAGAALATMLARLLLSLGFAEALSYVLYMAACVAVAAGTRSYLAGAVAVAVSCLLQDYLFIRPFNDLTIDHRASLYVFVAFSLLSALAAGLVAHTRRVALRSERRERRTQALFDLDRSLLYAHTTVEVADVALRSCVRLFGRSVALFLQDPFADASRGRDRKAPFLELAEGDAGAGEFEKLTELAVVHWVFSNGSPAGNGTGTHEASDLYFLPLQGQEGLEGVLAVSCRRPLNLTERSFLDLVAGEISLALERQSLAAKHRSDLQVMRVTGIRSAFVAHTARLAVSTVDMVHALDDALLAAPEDNPAYRDALERVILDESARGRLMIDRVQRVVDAPTAPQCDVRAVVGEAVDEVREGLAGKVIDLEPGEPTAPIVADAVLVRLAVRLVLEAATSYVGSRGIVQVDVRAYADRVSVVVADDRAPDTSPSRGAAFETAARNGEEGVPVYEEVRARALREVLANHAVASQGQQAVLAALCKVMHLPEQGARGDGDRGDAINRQRVLRFDRLEYGLYVAALIARVHGGTIKQRYRLGGGAVVTISFPRS